MQKNLSAAVVVASIDLAIGSSLGYLLPYHRCFSDMAQPGSTSDYGVPEQSPASTAENGMDVAGDAPYFLRAVARSILVGGVWAFSSRTRRQSARRALGLTSSRWHRLASFIGRSKHSRKPTFSEESSRSQELPRRRLTRCATEPSRLGPLAPTLLQCPSFEQFRKSPCDDDSDTDVESGRASRAMTKRKTEPPMRFKYFTEEVQGSEGASTPTSWAYQQKSNLSKLRSRSRQVPSYLDLEEIYDSMVPQGNSCITPALLKDVVKVLNQRYSVDFQESDAERLHRMMKADNDSVTRVQFIETTFSLLRAVKSAKVPLSFSQLRLIMGTAFERFDINADGDLSLEEFSAALLSFDINIPEKQTKILLQFLSQNSGKAMVLNKEDFAMKGASSSSEEQLLEAVVNAKEKVADFTGWRSAVEIKDKVVSICLGEGDLGQKMNRLRETLKAEQVADSTELALSIASFAMVLLNTPAHAAVVAPDLGNQVLRSVAESLPSATSVLLQSGQMGPILLAALLAASKAMRKQGTISLGGNEALLYVQSFQQKGCSLSFFHKLIACSEYRWGSAKPGDYLLLNSIEPELKILLHGKGQRKGMEVGPGAVLMKHSEDDKVQIEESVTYIAWNVRKLTELIKHTKDPALVKLVRDMIQEADPGYADFDEKASERPKSVNGLLSALSEAVELQAKRKGLAMCYQLVEGLQRLILNTNATAREKMCQCRALLLESADDLMEGLEALADFAEAFSALTAIVTHAGDGLTPDEVVQLAPLFMLASLTLGKTANSIAGDANEGLSG